MDNDSGEKAGDLEKQGLSSGQNNLNGPVYQRMFSDCLQPISSSSHSALLSEYSIMDPTSFYKNLLDFPPTEIRDTYTLVKNIDGLINFRDFKNFTESIDSLNSKEIIAPKPFICFFASK